MIDRNILLMSLGAITIGFSPIITKAVTLSPTMTAFYRFLFGTIAILTFLLIKKIRPHKESLKAALPFLFCAGFMFGLDLWFWHRSIVYTGAGVATLLANTQVFYLIIFGWIFYKERPKWFFYPAVLLALLGLTLSSSPYLNFNGFDNSFWGIIFGLLTGLSYAFVAFYMKKATLVYKGQGPWPIFIITIVATATTFIFAAFEGNIQLISLKDLPFMVTYGAGIHFLGWLLITLAITRISLALASLLLLLQPVFATIFGNLIYQEPLSSTQAFGLLISLIGIYLASIAKTK